MRRAPLFSLVALAALSSCAPSAKVPAPRATGEHPEVQAPSSSPVAAAPVTTPEPATLRSARDTLPRDEPLLAPEDTRWGPPRPAVPSGKPGAGAEGDSYGAGGLGLSGVGEGGGGRGEGVGLGSAGTIGAGAGRGRLGGAHATKSPSVRMGATSVSGSGASAAWGVAAPAPTPAFVGVRAGEWDDNANFRDFMRWLDTERAPSVAAFDLRSRRFVVVRDASGKPVPSCPVEIAGGSGSVQLLTTSSGRSLLFPFADRLGSAPLTATARCEGASVTQSFDAAPGDAVVTLTLPEPRAIDPEPTLDVAFVLDTTGSMSEEIVALRDTLGRVASALGKLNVRPRVGLVEYKDRGDEYVTRLHPMTTDVAGLEQRIAGLAASGGGDTPEHVNEAVRVAVRRLAWRPSSLARLVFLIGDAPPHLDYSGDEGYAAAVLDASHRGIQIYSIAASGMDGVGQVVFRQMAQLTGGTHMFVLRGGAGPQSTGAGDARSSCGDTHQNYTSGDLDELVLGKVQAAIRARDADPLRIAGLGQDERAKPCDQRVMAVAAP